MKLISISRLASKEPVTAMEICSSVCVLLWPATLKPVPIWVWKLVTGERLLTAVSLAYKEPYFEALDFELQLAFLHT